MCVCLRHEIDGQGSADDYQGKGVLVLLDGLVDSSQSSIPVRGFAFVLYMANESTWSSPFRSIVWHTHSASGKGDTKPRLHDGQPGTGPEAYEADI